MIKAVCFKCGKEKLFSSASSIWTAGWEPVSKDQYKCDHCCQLPDLDDLPFTTEFINDIDVDRKPKKAVDLNKKS